MEYRKHVLIGALLLLFCCTTLARAERKEFTPPIDKDGVQRVEIVAGSYFFDPNYLIVKVNVPVELRIRKEEGILPHDFVLRAPDAGMDVKADLSGDPAVITFTPTKTGTYPFYCDKKFLFLESHKDKGMEGTLEVR